MSLLWVRCGSEVLCGESTTLLSGTEENKGAPPLLLNPMLLQMANVESPQKIHGAKPKLQVGFRFLALPCSEILLNDVVYMGVIKDKDPVFALYYTVLEGMKRNDDSPAMVTQ